MLLHPSVPRIFDYAAPACIPRFLFSISPALFVFRLKANCQLDDLDWIWEPVEPVACNSENNLLPPDVVVVVGPRQRQPPRRASLEIANFIFRHEIQLRGTHSENFSDYWSNCDDNNIGSYFAEETAGGLEEREGHVDEGVRPHLEVKPTFHIQLHFTFGSHSAFVAAWNSSWFTNRLTTYFFSI